MSDQVVEVVALVGRRLDETTPALVADLTVYLGERIPELRDDARLRELLQASISANLTTVCHMLINRIAVESTKAPAAALEYAVRHAQNDMPGSTLVRAYMVGQSLLLQRAMDLVNEQSVSAGIQQQAIAIINQDVHAYTDRVLQALIDAHENERRQWLNTRARIRRSTVQQALRDEEINADDFARETDYSLAGTHRAFIAWMPEHNPGEQTHLENDARKVASALGSHEPPLLIAADAATIWGWIRLPSPAVAVATIENALAPHAPLRLALGLPAEGIAGFRRSHAQALDAQLMAMRSPALRARACVSIDDAGVGLGAILARDLGSSRAWITAQLGELAANTATARALRETIVAYTAHGESYARTAEALGVHRNTVTGRLERFFANRDQTTLDLSELSVAIRMFELLPTN